MKDKQKDKQTLNVSRVCAFDDNYIWIIHSNNADNDKNIIIVDPGDAQPVLEFIHKYQYIPSAIFITHHHGDHCGGVHKILASYDIPVYGPSNETVAHVTHPCKHEETVFLNKMNLSFKIMDVPGHTKGHIAFFGHKSLFIGDTLFAGGCGRVFEGTFEQMYDSLYSLLTLEDDTLIYCAHEYTQDNLKFAIIAEPNNHKLQQRILQTNIARSKDEATVPSFLKLEKETNPFLRFNEPELIKSAENYCGHGLYNPTDVFKITRQWKDFLD